MNRLILLLFLLAPQFIQGQKKNNFKIRTITAGVSLSDLSDTLTIINTIQFLKTAGNTFTKNGYEVQSLRIATQSFYQYVKDGSYMSSIPFLKKMDQIAKRENVSISIGELLAPDQYRPYIAEWSVTLIKATENINFSIPIASVKYGLHINSIRAAAEIAMAISKNTTGGEGNFRFTASANCPPGIPFFPAAYHTGKKSFAIGFESPNLLAEVFSGSDWNSAREKLKQTLENKFKPVEDIAKTLSKSSGWNYNGIDTSPAPGLDASIGYAIEVLTKQPFGEPSTLRACALITDVIKNLGIKTCGYSGLMLPVIEDNLLAQRAAEGRFTVQELLLFSAVSGTGLDVIPVPGNTSLQTLERIYTDVGVLSLKYSNKALSARLFLIPGKEAGDVVEFDNPYLTTATVMKVE